MKIRIKNQISSLSNQDIKWYLSDETLWVTKYDEYADVENSIELSRGSFNWLYEINDTVLFDKETGEFKIAIIRVPRKLEIKQSENLLDRVKDKKIGGLYLADKIYCDFEFPSFGIYDPNKDYLIALSERNKIDKMDIVFITNDFGFLVMNDQLKGWVLKNSSKHIYATGRIVNRNPELLSKYLNALNFWEVNEEDTYQLKKLLESIETQKDDFSLVIKECIINIL